MSDDYSGAPHVLVWAGAILARAWAWLAATFMPWWVHLLADFSVVAAWIASIGSAAIVLLQLRREIRKLRSERGRPAVPASSEQSPQLPSESEP